MLRGCKSRNRFVKDFLNFNFENLARFCLIKCISFFFNLSQANKNYKKNIIKIREFINFEFKKLNAFKNIDIIDIFLMS